MPIDKNKIKYDYFTFDGAISKQEFQRSFVILLIIAIVVNSFTYNVYYPVGLTGLLLFAIRIILLIAFISITMRRLRDIGSEPIFALLWIIPPLGFLLSLYLLIAERKTIL